jgi:transglutaminase-like putative cysteine protease
MGVSKMKLQFESDRFEDYLGEVSDVVEFKSPIIQQKINEIKLLASTKQEQARFAFQFVRDEIDHSFDTNSKVITISAENTLAKKEGICFAKSHLLASLLRGMGIPAGFCYQRVVRKGTIESGHALHGLNAVYLEETGWFRVDPRGNKPGIQSEFSTEKEKLAYPIRVELGEVDYPTIYMKPLAPVINSMQNSKDCHALFYNRPELIH